MTTDEFAAIVRGGNDKLRVDDVVVQTGQTELRGRGLMRIEREEICIDLTLADPAARRELPRAHVVTKRDWWKLSGIIEDGVAFRCDNVSPGGPEAFRNGIVVLSRELHTIELAEPPEHKRARQQKLRESLGLSDTGEAEEKHSFSFEATLVDFPLPAVNGDTTTVSTNTYTGRAETWAGDTFVGETAHIHYGLVRAKNKSDLQVYVRSKEDFQSSGPDDDEQIFQAFLRALGFVTGIQPWPFRTKHTHGYSLISDRLTAARRLPRTLQAPFGSGLHDSHAAAFERALRCGAEFLAEQSEFREKITHLAWMFREAGDEGVHLDIKILATCTLLESLVRTIFADRGEKDAEGDARFRLARQRIVELITSEAKSAAGGVEFERLRAMVAEAAPLTIQGMFRAVAANLSLDWDKQLQPVFAEWRRARNPAAHGHLTSEDPDPDVDAERVKDLFFGYSRVAGGFNMLMLKLLGYSGLYRASVLEDRYETI